MKVSFTYMIPAHVADPYFPAFVALAMRIPGLSSVKLMLNVRALEMEVNLPSALDLSKIPAELDALGLLETCFCPCGCNAVIVFDTCFQADPPTPILVHGLTIGETELLKAGKKIDCIKEIRRRLGVGLKDAKDLADEAQRKLGVTPGDWPDPNAYYGG